MKRVNVNRLSTCIRVSAVSAFFVAGSVLSSVSAASETYYFHADHLGAPQVLTNDAAEVVWQGHYEPFGEVVETVSEVEQNLRFPGQYLDRETGLHQNWYRSYDPQTGRYVRSDPIGLDGGLNTYGYAEANPLVNTDPTGESATASVSAVFSADVAVPEPTDAAWPKWVGWGLLIGGAIIYDMCTADGVDDSCEALYQSTLRTCASLKGRKKFQCFEAARINREQCYRERRREE